jgi:hypothetical protein
MSVEPEQAGGTEGGNTSTVAVSGRAMIDDEQPAVNAEVILRRTDYLAGHPGLTKRGGVRFETRTDKSGRFTFDSVSMGSYFIEINNGTALAALHALKVPEASDDVELPEKILTAHAAVTGRIIFEDSIIPKTYVQVYGLERMTEVDPLNGVFGFSDMPAGAYTVRIVSLWKSSTAVRTARVTLSPGGTEAIPVMSFTSFNYEDYGTWSHSAVITLNTTSSGADVSDDVYNFPLLIRLSSSSSSLFSIFDEAQSNGSDIRFAKEDGTHLQYEIEQWDADLRLAAIWVIMDTVYGSSDAQSITMYWGNGDAPAFSNGAAVFDTANSFISVFHLNENPAGDPPGAVKDRTYYANHGSPDGNMDLDNLITGMVGNAISFDGYNDIIVADTMGLNTYSFSLWVKGDHDPRTDTLTKPLCYGWEVFEFVWDHVDDRHYQSHTHRYDTTWSGWVGASIQTPLHADTWYYVSGTYDGDVITIYLNGELEQVTKVFGVRSPTLKFTLGGQEDGRYYFAGSIDEVRVQDRARNGAWFKLCYENQKERNSLVIIE